jgi:hypothetical protein
VIKRFQTSRFTRFLQRSFPRILQRSSPRFLQRRFPRSKDGWFNTRLYIAAAVLGLLGAVFLYNFSKADIRSGKDGYSTVEIVNRESGKIYGRRLLKDGDEFAVEFVHSVNNSPVREIFTAADGKIQSKAVRFYSFGAGMQTDLEDGQEMIRDGDALIITGYKNIHTELNYIVGTVSDHLLLINGEQISLRKLCGKNAHVTLRIKGERS